MLAVATVDRRWLFSLSLSLYLSRSLCDERSKVHVSVTAARVRSHHEIRILRKHISESNNQTTKQHNNHNKNYNNN